MNPKDLPEDSDTSDEDYVPDGKNEEAVSEVESDGDPESGSENEAKVKGRKYNKISTKSKKKKIIKEEEENSPVKKQNKADTEEKKLSADDLWADFMKDTGFKPKNSGNTASTVTSKPDLSKKEEHKKEESKKEAGKVKVTQIFEFAGEEVKVEKEVDASSAEARLLTSEDPKSSKVRKRAGLSGIGNVLSQLGKKQKISTLEKSKLDWDRFKKEENIEEELQTHNKGKDGYLEKQDFLQRADLRRFEIEKDLRNAERAKRFNTTM